MTDRPPAGTYWRRSIPGKVMIAGEYSVLGPGGVALAIAVAPGIEISARTSPVETLLRRDTGESWASGEVPPGLAFIHSALRSVQGVPPLRVEAWTASEVGSGDIKPGFGGSASAVVGGLWLGWQARDGHLPPLDAFVQQALDVHRAGQNGRGSGYDVATIAVGDATLWTVLETDAVGVARGRAERAPLAGGLGFLAGYAGRSASTTRLVTRVADRLGAARDAAYAELGAPVPRLVAAVGSPDRQELAEATREAREAMVQFDTRVGGGLVTPEIEALFAVADALGVPCKVSGAGGGDSVVAFDLDSERLEALRTAWESRGHRAFALRVAPGVWSPGPADQDTL